MSYFFFFFISCSDVFRVLNEGKSFLRQINLILSAKHGLDTTELLVLLNIIKDLVTIICILVSTITLQYHYNFLFFCKIKNKIVSSFVLFVKTIINVTICLEKDSFRSDLSGILY